jgi:hypothetical protein
LFNADGMPMMTIEMTIEMTISRIHDMFATHSEWNEGKQAGFGDRKSVRLTGRNGGSAVSVAG